MSRRDVRRLALAEFGPPRTFSWGRFDVVFEPGRCIDSTVDELIAAHGAQVTYVLEPDECLPPWMLWLNDPSGDRQSRITVVLEGPPGQGTTRIARMSAGAANGC